MAKRKSWPVKPHDAARLADNKIYLLRSLRCRGSSGARPYAPKMPSSHKRQANSKLSEIIAPLCFADLRVGAASWSRSNSQLFAISPYGAVE